LFFIKDAIYSFLINILFRFQDFNQAIYVISFYFNTQTVVQRFKICIIAAETI